MAARPKRKTIGDNPLNAVVPRGPAQAAVADTEPPKQAKERMTFHLPAEVMERAKNAVYWTPSLTLADLAAQALTDTVDRLEKKKGEPHSLPGRRNSRAGGR